jgi:hypothetical protein
VKLKTTIERILGVRCWDYAKVILIFRTVARGCEKAKVGAAILQHQQQHLAMALDYLKKSWSEEIPSIAI